MRHKIKITNNNMKEIKLFDVEPTLISRLWNQLDTYEIANIGYTIEDLKGDLQNSPLSIIDFLLTRLEDMEG